jgi:hypothetical protein
LQLKRQEVTESWRTMKVKREEVTEVTRMENTATKETGSNKRRMENIASEEKKVTEGWRMLHNESFINRIIHRILLG